MIEHANIIYMPTISALGGIETYVYELVKKYHDLDIAVVSRKCDDKQAERIRKYCKLYIHENQKIKCKVAIINYDQRIINYINDDALIYQAIHADYTNPIYDHRPQPNSRVYRFIGITKYLKDKMADMLKPNEITLCYNPLTIEKEDKPLILVSATRLHKHKGRDRMQILANKLDKKKINYIWFVITNETEGLESENVIFIKNRLDISRWLELANYVVLLSDSEACSYTINEALYRNIPVIVTPLPYLEEIGVKDGVNSYIMNFDCSNVDSIVDRITNVPKFEFNQMQDGYDKIFYKSKSKYEEELKMKVEVQCIENYFDMEEDERKVTSVDVPYDNPEQHPNRVIWVTNKARADHLVNRGKVKILRTIKEEVKETAIPEEKKEKAVKEVKKTKAVPTKKKEEKAVK